MDSAFEVRDHAVLLCIFDRILLHDITEQRFEFSPFLPSFSTKRRGQSK
jgi:hypothetical protein